MVEFDGLTLLRLSAVLHPVLRLAQSLTHGLRLRRTYMGIVVRLYGRRGRCVNREAVVRDIVRQRMMYATGTAIQTDNTITIPFCMFRQFYWENISHRKTKPNP